MEFWQFRICENIVSKEKYFHGNAKAHIHNILAFTLLMVWHSFKNATPIFLFLTDQMFLIGPFIYKKVDSLILSAKGEIFSKLKFVEFWQSSEFVKILSAKGEIF